MRGARSKIIFGCCCVPLSCGYASVEIGLCGLVALLLLTASLTTITC
jgi:hypothetical protein